MVVDRAGRLTEKNGPSAHRPPPSMTRARKRPPNFLSQLPFIEVYARANPLPLPVSVLFERKGRQCGPGCLPSRCQHSVGVEWTRPSKKLVVAADATQGSTALVVKVVELPEERARPPPLSPEKGPFFPNAQNKDTERRISPLAYLIGGAHKSWQGARSGSPGIVLDAWSWGPKPPKSYAALILMFLSLVRDEPFSNQ